MKLIPTAHKEKIPKGFKYPVGAELVSRALSGAPQFGLFELRFSWKDSFWASEYRARINAAGAMEIMEIEYSPHARLHPPWTIRVYAVPSAEGQSAKELLEHSLQTLKTRLMSTGMEPGYFSWKAIYDLATRTLRAG
jgi:hypothetical protein